MDTASHWNALLLFPLLLAICAAAGGQLLRWLRVEPANPLEGFVFAAAAGMGALAYAILAAGLLGAFHRTAFLLLLLAFAALGAPHALSVVRRRGKEGRPTTDHRPPTTDHRPPMVGGQAPSEFGDRQSAVGGRWSVVGGRSSVVITWATAAAALYLAGGTLLAALAPPAGNDWDGLAYHLAAPKVYLNHGRIEFIPYDSHTNFPFTLEMLYGLGLALGGAPLAKLFHWSAGGLTALAAAAFCVAHFSVDRRLPTTDHRPPTTDQGPMTANRRPGDAPLRKGPIPGGVEPAVVGGRWSVVLPPWGPTLAAALFLAVPQIAWEATTAYIDLGTALFQFLALYAAVNAVSRDELRWWLVAGAMSGWAMGTKMTAMLPFGMLLAAAAWWAVRARRPRAWRGVLALGLLGVTVASPWYVKSWLWTNNPVYPFFFSLFPRSINWTSQAEAAYRMEQNSFGMGHGLADLARAPWHTAMDGARFFTVWSKDAPEGSVPRYLGDLWGSVGIALLGLAPLWPFAGRLDRRALWLLAYVGASFFTWFFLTQQTRYLLPALVPAGIAAVVLFHALPRGLMRGAAGCLLAVQLLVGLLATQRLTIAPALPVVLGRESRDAYLQRTLRDVYPAMRFVNTLPADSRIAFFQEVRGFYADRDYFWANPLQHNLIPYEQFPDGRAMTRFLHERLGITHVLLNDNFARGSEETTWYRLLQDAARQGALEPLYEAHGVKVFAIQ